MGFVGDSIQTTFVRLVSARLTFAGSRMSTAVIVTPTRLNTLENRR